MAECDPEWEAVLDAAMEGESCKVGTCSRCGRTGPNVGLVADLLSPGGRILLCSQCCVNVLTSRSAGPT